MAVKKRKSLEESKPQEKEKSNTEETVGSLPTVSPTTPEAITVGDIKTMIAVINTASTRGAFRANEMTTVGQLHDKLSRFVVWYDSQTKPSTEGDNDAN